MGVTVEAQQPQAQRKRAPLVPIEPGAPKQPDFKKHQADCQVMKDEIDKLYREIEALTEKAKENKEDTVKDELRKKKLDLGQQRRKKLDDIQKLRDQLKREFEKAQDARKQVREGERASRQAMRNTDANLTVADINKDIADLENRMETGMVSTIKGEKKIIQQIKDLKKKREEIAGVHENIDAHLTKAEQSQADADSAVSSAQTLQQEMDKARAEVKDLLDRIDQTQKEIEERSQNTELQKQREEQQQLWDKVKAKKAKLTEFRDKFTEDKEKYNVWREDYNKRCDAERKRRDEERRKENALRDQERKERELELRSIHRMNPHEKEINLAETLIGYLRNKCGGQLPTKKVEKVAHFDAAAANFGNGKFKVLKKDEEKDMSLDFGKKKKPAAAQKFVPKQQKKDEKAEAVPEKKVRKITHDFGKEGCFKELGVETPKTTEEAKKVIEELKEKKAFWESKKKTQREAMDEEEAERKAKAEKEGEKDAVEAEEF